MKTDRNTWCCPPHLGADAESREPSKTDTAKVSRSCATEPETEYAATFLDHENMWQATWTQMELDLSVRNAQSWLKAFCVSSPEHSN